MSPATWLALLGAIGFEVMGTTLLQQSQAQWAWTP